MPELNHWPHGPAGVLAIILEAVPAWLTAGFRGLRNAVPFDRIKAKKIPIVQPNLTFSLPKIH
ncbi:hypothetical protein ACU8OJ_14480 [Rhizobium leguminosarum]